MLAAFTLSSVIGLIWICLWFIIPAFLLLLNIRGSWYEKGSGSGALQRPDKSEPDAE